MYALNERAPRFDAVCFDFDSTLSRIEGIDELAVRAGAAERIEPMTKAAMDGVIPLQDIYGMRLEIIQPARADLDWLAQRYIEQEVPGASETIETLRRSGVSIYIISGGIRGAILPFAAKCAIAPDRVFAVDVMFGTAGEYLDFDRSSPLAGADGKAAICATLKERHQRLALVGDGTTDVAARNGGAFVVGFGGVVAREAVRKGADIFVPGPKLTDVLDELYSSR